MRRTVLALALALPAPLMAQDAAPLRACYAQAADRAAGEACVGRILRPCMARPEGETTVGMMTCLIREADAWEALLAQEYAGAITLMRADDEIGRDSPPPHLRREEALIAAQQAWLAWREAECGFAYAQWGSGSFRVIAAGDCRVQMTARRTLDLRDLGLMR